MLAYPFRPPPAEVKALAGSFEFNDDSLWWKGASARLPKSNLKGDGTYNINNGDMRLTLAATPAAFDDFKWLYQRFPAEGGGNLGLAVVWKGATQDYVVRDADVRSGSAHVLGDVGVTIADTTFFHDANLRFTGVTTKQIAELDPTLRSPRQGVLSGRAKFSGTLKRLAIADADVTFLAYGRGTNRVQARGVVGFSGPKYVVSARDLRLRILPLQIDIVKLLFPTLPVGGTLTGSLTLNGNGATQLVATNLDIVHQDGPNRSHAVGRGAVHTTGQPTLDLDVVAQPLALAELTKFAPALPLKGLVTGPVHAHGPIDAMRVDTRLAVPGGASFAMRGTIDFKSKELGYDVVADATALDLSRVVIGAPRDVAHRRRHGTWTWLQAGDDVRRPRLRLRAVVRGHDAGGLAERARPAGERTRRRGARATACRRSAGGRCRPVRPGQESLRRAHLLARRGLAGHPGALSPRARPRHRGGEAEAARDRRAVEDRPCRLGACRSRDRGAARDQRRAAGTGANPGGHADGDPPQRARRIAARGGDDHRLDQPLLAERDGERHRTDRARQRGAPLLGDVQLGERAHGAVEDCRWHSPAIRSARSVSPSTAWRAISRT